MELTLTHAATGFKDKIKVTVFGVDLDIYNGQGSSSSPPVPETDQDGDGIEDEEDIGAFTVANMNDTNGDGYVDSDNNHRPVTANGNRGRNEIDLMKLVLRKPMPASMTGDVRLTVVSGPCSIWSDSVKTTQITNLTFPTSNFTSDTIVWYVEATSSTVLQGIKLKYEFKPTGGSEWLAPDTVSATGVWASCTRICSANKTAVEVDTYMGTDYVTNGGNARAQVNSFNGTGVAPSGKPYQNAILLEFSISPSNISSIPSGFRPYFDLTRAKEIFAVTWGATGIENVEPCMHFPETLAADGNPQNDRDFEYVNDDSSGTDETSEPAASGYMWVADAPGFPYMFLLGAYRGNFDEFLRMGISADPAGNGIVASRCSAKTAWHSKKTLGSIGECAGTNEIGTGHFTFESEALHTYAPGPTLTSYSTVVTRGLGVAAIAGSTVETVDLRVMERDLSFHDTLAMYDGQHIGANYDIHDATTVASKPRMVGKSTTECLVGDQTAYVGVTSIGTGVDGEIWGYHGSCGEDTAEVFHMIGSSCSPVDDCEGTLFSMSAPSSPNPLVLGNNNVTCSPLYVAAAAHGGGTQSVWVDLWEDDVLADYLANVDAVGTRPADAIQNTAIPVTAAGGGPVTFIVSNSAGTISGNQGASEAKETPVQLYYFYTVGQSPMTTVNVQQP